MKKYALALVSIMMSNILQLNVCAAPSKKSSSKKHAQTKQHTNFNCPAIASLDSISDSSKPVLLVFYADWCPMCHKMMPALNEFLANNPDVAAYSVNTGADGQALGQKFGVSGIPTMVVVQKNKAGKFEEVDRFVGNLSLQEIESSVGPVMHAKPSKQPTTKKNTASKKAEEFACPLISSLSVIPDIDTPILLMFYAEWCPQCHGMIDAFNEFTGSKPQLSTYRIDVGGSGQSIGKKFNVSGIPTMIVVAHDDKGNLKEIQRFVGNLSLQELEKRVGPVACPVK